MYEQFVGVKPVEERHRFDVTRLEQYLRSCIEGFAGPLEVEQFRGGQSNPTSQLPYTTQRQMCCSREPVHRW